MNLITSIRKAHHQLYFQIFINTLRRMKYLQGRGKKVHYIAIEFNHRHHLDCDICFTRRDLSCRTSIAIWMMPMNLMQLN